MKPAAATALLMLSAASAAASSFVTPPPLTERLGPSMIALGAPAASAPSSSIMALGQPARDAAPDVEMTNVASIAQDESGEEAIEQETPAWVLDQIALRKPVLQKPRQARRFAPMVIRAGLSGDAFAAPPAAAAAPAPRQVSTDRPEPAGAPQAAQPAAPASQPSGRSVGATQ